MLMDMSIKIHTVKMLVFAKLLEMHRSNQPGTGIDLFLVFSAVTGDWPVSITCAGPVDAQQCRQESPFVFVQLKYFSE